MEDTNVIFWIIYILFSCAFGIPIVRYYMGKKFPATNAAGDMDGAFDYLFYAIISVLIFPAIPFYVLGLILRFYGQRTYILFKNKWDD